MVLDVRELSMTRGAQAKSKVDRGDCLLDLRVRAFGVKSEKQKKSSKQSRKRKRVSNSNDEEPSNAVVDYAFMIAIAKLLRKKITRRL